jgi:hypothetical protein
MHHYCGGWYTMTDETWPVIGHMGPTGAFVYGAISAFGTMAACAAGSLCANWVMLLNKEDLPKYANAFLLNRYQDGELMASLKAADGGGLVTKLNYETRASDESTLHGETKSLISFSFLDGRARNPTDSLLRPNRANSLQST